MKKNKLALCIIILILIIVLGIFMFIKLQSKNNKTYQLYVKLDTLVLFEINSGDNPMVTNYKFQTEEDSKLFSDINFVGMTLKESLDKYLEIEKNNGVTLTNIFVWTNWDNSKYFEGSNYKLNIISNDSLSEIPETIKPELIYNKGYYRVGDEHNFNIVIKENGVLEYHVDEYTDTFCDEFMEDSCFEATIDDEYYNYASNANTYEFNDNKLILKAKENEAYFGWVYAYDDCEIMYNALKCDYYNSNHTTTPVYQNTIYYEIR